MAILLWIFIIGGGLYLLFTFMGMMQKQKSSSNKNPTQRSGEFQIPIKKIIIGIVLIFLLFGSIYTVGAGYRGVVLTFGKPSDTIAQEGFHLKIPIAQTVRKMEVRTQKIQTQADSASLDLQDVQTTIALNFHVNPSFVNKLYQEVGLEYQGRVIDPAIQESVKAISAKFKAEELITKRPQVRSQIQKFLADKLRKYYIVIDDFNIENFQFSEQFDEAIESKVTAEQLKLKAERDLERIEIEALQKVAQAKGQAESIDIINSELQRSPNYIQWMKIEKWNGILPIATGGAVPFIDIGTNAQLKQTEAQ